MAADSLNHPKFRVALSFYDLCWSMVIPLLRLNRRLKDGYDQRRLKSPLPRADLWIQAASGGEAYLARTLLSRLCAGRPLNVLITANTRQGMEIIERIGQDEQVRKNRLHIYTAYFPFDRPNLMNRAVSRVSPRLAVLLETEIWPGFFFALKQSGCPIMIANGRMTSKSFSGYRRWSSLFYPLRPDRVLAVSAADAGRFSAVFGHEIVSEMPNIKFDRVATPSPSDLSAVRRLIPDGPDFCVLGSVREEEEPQVSRMIPLIRSLCPDTVIGLFPRHMHRIASWRDILDRLGRWTLRSRATDRAPAGTVILWDTFGELNSAYSCAKAVFVGGSLAPLGGQNFLEPLVQGVVPVIGPSYENFEWAGEDVFQQNLVEKAENWQSAVKLLIERLNAPAADRKTISAKAIDYIKARQGGTDLACREIMRMLGGVSE